MLQFFEDNWLFLLALTVGIGGLWLGVTANRQQSDSRAPWKRYLIWGPFAPAVDNYLAKRGGYSKREILGWLFVVFLLLAIFISAFFIEY